MSREKKNMHPYDGKQRRYRHEDVETKEEGRALLGQVLGLETVDEEALYDLSFYSGGTGVFDVLGAVIPSDEVLWKDVVVAFEALSPTHIVQEKEWIEDFVWLVDDEDSLADAVAQLPGMNDEQKQTFGGLLLKRAIAFINEERMTFQEECTPMDLVFFERWSDVNHWAVFWGTPVKMNFRLFDQG